MSLPDNLPSTLRSKFVSEYQGHKAAIFQSASEANNVAIMLKNNGISHIHKIVKRKKRPNLFVVACISSY